MDNNKLMINADMDITQAEKKLSDLQKKIKNMNQTAEGSFMSDLSQQYRNNNQNDKADRIERMRQQINKKNRQELIQDLEKQEKYLQKHMNMYEKMDKALGMLTKGTYEYTQVQQRRNKAEDEFKATLENIKKIQDSLDNKGGLGGGSAGGFLGGISGVAKTLAGITTAIKLLSEVADFSNRKRGLYKAERTISLAESTYAPIKRALKGQAYEDIIFADEKSAALKDTMAMGANQFGINRASSFSLGAAGLGAAGLGGMLGLAGLAALATAPFTMGGSLLAAGGLGLAGMGTALLTGNNGLNFEALTGDFGEVDKKTGIQLMDYFKKKEAEKKAENLTETAMKEFLLENRQSIISGLRQSGMGEEVFTRDFIQGKGLSRYEDFSFQQRMQSAQEILSAGGGSTSAYGQNAILALQAQRGMGISNAGSIIGNFSSYAGAAGGSEAFENAMARAVSIGLDKSQYRQEHKSYLTVVSQMARERAGGEDFISSAILSGIGNDITQRNVEISAESFKDLASSLSQKGGHIGAGKFALLDKLFPELKQDMSARYALASADVRDINKDNKYLDFIYEKFGKKRFKSKEDMVKTLRDDVYVPSETFAFGNTAIGKELAALDKKKREEGLTEFEEMDAIGKYGLFSDVNALSPKARPRYNQRFTGVINTDAAKEQEEEYYQLRYNEKNLDEKQKERLKELEKGLPGFKNRPEGFMEFNEGAQGMMQNKLLQEDLSKVMTKLATNTNEILNKTLEQQINLTKFNEALAKHAPEMLKAIVEKLSGKKMPTMRGGMTPYGFSVSNMGTQKVVPTGQNNQDG